MPQSAMRNLQSAMGLAALVCVLSACERDPSANPPSAMRNPQLAVPARGAYQGAYIDFGDTEDHVTLEGIENFEKMAGKHQAIVASSSYWGEGTFPTNNVKLISRHGSLPLLYWSPWDKPYIESRGPDKFALNRILAGEHDAYIDAWADAAREFGQPLIVSFANEMNGSWFPWSGELYGGEKVLSVEPARDGKPAIYHYEGPETFKKTWRYVVDRVRARGAKNIQWVLHLMIYSDPQAPWNMAANYYPGPDYVDWLGLSLYGSQFPADKEWAPFFPLLDWPYTELTLIDSSKPIMLCEWGVAELPHLGSKAEWFREGFKLMKEPRFSKIKAIVYWHERWQNSKDDMAGNAGKYSNLRINSTPESLEAYHQGLADPFFLENPKFTPASER